ncbi:MAG: ABC transporter ATP-binding protein, partial [Bacteroidia bacterium]
HLFVFEGNGVIRDFNGNYTDYRLERDEIEKQQKADKSVEKEIFRKQEKLKGKPSFKDVHAYEQLEKEIPALEKEIEGLSSKMNEGVTDHEELLAISEKIAVLTKQLEEKGSLWLQLAEKLES